VAENTRCLLDDAYSRVLEMNRLQGFGYHPNNEATIPRTQHGGMQQSVYFRFRAPASQRADKSYKCWMECMTAKFPSSHPFVTKIIGAGCDCPLGMTGECVHVLMCAFTVHLLPRPVHIVGAIQQPTTSVLCAWADPGKGETYDVTTSLAHIPFMRVKMKKRNSHARTGSASENNSSRRVLQVAETDGWRNKFISISDKDMERLSDSRNHPARVAARHALWRAAKRAQGAMCAAESAFGMLDGDLHLDPYTIRQLSVMGDEEAWGSDTSTSTDDCSDDSGGGTSSSDSDTN